ncbi:cartilage matrix protein-like [Mizuhopecten yessoensis]|uniref:cartilage matrix protein-like n=1 Tax=Mizuhopecten yessoensis TaxID=6573 RepID=UPI000B45B2C5|nr:cartilage matrix protein-like [Mizuhopecten yessoensis]
MSTSVGYKNFHKVLEFLEAFLFHDDIDSGTVRVGVVGYSSDANVEFFLNQYSTTDTLYKAIDNIQYMLGNTNTAAGLRVTRSAMFTVDHGDRPDAENIAIIVTDGVSNVNSRNTIPEAEMMRNSGIKIYAIGVGLVETQELTEIASKPIEDHLFLADDFSGLNNLHDQVLDSFCLEPVPTLRPEPAPSPEPEPTLPGPDLPPVGSISPLHKC